MEIVGGFALADGTSAKALTGLDDYCFSTRGARAPEASRSGGKSGKPF